MKKPVKILYIILLAVLIVLPAPVYLIFGRFFDHENYENRTLAELPILSVSTINSYPNDFNQYWMDNLPFKSDLVYWNGYIDYKVFGSAGSQYVIVGKNGWLFYKGQQANFENPEADYMGLNLFTDEELERIKDNMLRARDLLEERGTEFYIFIAPNKERVYSEFMPDAYGEPAEMNRMRQVVEYLKSETDLNVLCPYDDLMAFKAEHPEIQLYYKYDTHWNNAGSYIGGRMLSEALGYPMPGLDEVTVKEIDNGTYDLATLMGLRDQLRDDHVYAVDDYTPYKISIVQDEGATEFRYNNPTGEGDPRKVYLVGDSFSTMMGIYVACHFNDMYMNSYKAYTGAWILAQEDPDICVYETVERYIGNMLDFDLEKGVGLGNF